MRRFKKAKISDVAAQAGVSITTVSRFVSGSENVCSPETAQRIRTAIAELHYTPSSLVSSVGRRATRTLGVCMYSPLDPEVAYGGVFFERLWRGVIGQADLEDYSLLHYPASVRGSESTDPFLDGRVDGLLYHPPTPVSESRDVQTRAARLAAAGMPTVLVTRSHDVPDSCGATFANESDTVALALSHLWEQGHRRIAHLAGPTGRISGDIAGSRLEAYSAWMRDRGVYDPALEGSAKSWRAEEAVAAEIALTVASWFALPERPTAVFAANDALALTVISAAKTLGWNVPADLSVVGVDNTPDAAAYGLTSVDAPIEEVGRASVRALLHLLQGAPIAECRLAVPVTSIMLRESVAPIGLNHKK